MTDKELIAIKKTIWDEAYTIAERDVERERAFWDNPHSLLHRAPNRTKNPYDVEVS